MLLIVIALALSFITSCKLVKISSQCIKKGTTETSGEPLILKHLKSSMKKHRKLVEMRSSYLSCIDSRNPHPAIGTPGGDFAEFTVALKVHIDNINAQSMYDDEVLLDKFVLIKLRQFVIGLTRPFYFHTGSNVIESVLSSKQLDSLPNVLSDFEMEPWLAQLVKPENIGCSHVKSMLLESNAYNVNPALVKAMIKAVYTLYWTPSLQDRIHLDIYKGKLSPSAVIQIQTGNTKDQSCAKFTLPIVPNIFEAHDSMFVNHPFAAKQFREKVLAPFFSSSTSFVDSLNDIADSQFLLTSSKLAQGLPVFNVTFQVE